MGHAILERVLLFGTRSADYIRTSGHNGCIATEVTLQATTGRIHDRTRTLRWLIVRFLLHRGHRPYMTQLDRLLRDSAATQHQVQPSVHLPEAVYEALRVAAFNERCKIHDIVLEGIELALGRLGRRNRPRG
jgi:hypothetical protein